MFLRGAFAPRASPATTSSATDPHKIRSIVVQQWFTRFHLTLAACLVLLAYTPAQAQIDDAQFQRDLETIASVPTRVIGSDGYAKTLAYLEQQIRALPNVEL